MNGDMLSDLRAARNGDKEVAGRLLEENSGLIWSVARRYFGRGTDPEEIAVAEAANGPTESLQRESGEDGFTLELVLGDYGAEERMLEQVNLRSLIEELPERERKVIALRYYHGLTQQNCAKVLHVSQVQISRLEKRAVERLRERFDL